MTPEKEEYAEVTIKLPKKIVDLFKAGLHFTKSAMSLEELLSRKVLWGLHNGVDELNNGLQQAFDLKLNSEHYGLDKIADC